jgi:NAD(P)H-hydrate epimerase
MRVCTAAQMAAIDRETIDGGVPGAELMERAGHGITEELLAFREDEGEARELPGSALIVCGKGNNGGDGLVIARLLADQAWDVTVLLLAPPTDLTPDARLNHERLPLGVTVVEAARERWVEQARALGAEVDLVIDAVFGTGIEPPLRPPYDALIAALNELPALRVAVDIPAGVSGDDGRVDPVAFRADLTVTVGLPKLGLLLPPGRDYVGVLHVVDIGFAPEVCRRYVPEHFYLDEGDYARLLPPRATTDHKYRCGHLMVFAGSRSFSGAVILVGRGALRTGAGLVTLGVPAAIEIPARSVLPEAIVAPLAATDRGTLAPLAPDTLADLLQKKTAVAIGPGLDAHPETDAWVVAFAGGVELPLVVDADGLSAFPRHGAAPRFAAEQVVLTPHAGELGRLVGRPPADVIAARFELLPELARRWGATILFKGSPTLIATPQGAVTVNPIGGDELAHGGTGDVLTGVVGGLLAQGRSAPEAAVLAAFLQGQAGVVAADAVGRRSVLAREVADGVATALRALEAYAETDPELRAHVRPDPGSS